jgi:hypothetical protein
MTTPTVSYLHAAVAFVALVCLTVLGVTGAMTEGTLSALFSALIGAVLGAGLNQVATNGQTRQVYSEAIERGLQLERDNARRSRQGRQG